MGFFANWRADRRRRLQALRYLSALSAWPSDTDVRWLTSRAGDRERAEQELAFARRAVGLIVAARDALDDRTASDVSRALAPTLETAGRLTSGSDWPKRWKAYSDAHAVRGQADPADVRLGRVLLSGAGVEAPTADDVTLASRLMQTLRSEANTALRAAFGTAELPEDVRPSAIRH